MLQYMKYSWTHFSLTFSGLCYTQVPGCTYHPESEHVWKQQFSCHWNIMGMDYTNNKTKKHRIVLYMNDDGLVKENHMLESQTEP